MIKTDKISNVTSVFSHMKKRLLNITWSNLRLNVSRSFASMATNLQSCFTIQFLEKLLKFLVDFEVSQVSMAFWLPNFEFKRSLLSLKSLYGEIDGPSLWGKRRKKLAFKL